jgi:hypothetical protein
MKIDWHFIPESWLVGIRIDRKDKLLFICPIPTIIIDISW